MRYSEVVVKNFILFA